MKKILNILIPLFTLFLILVPLCRADSVAMVGFGPTGGCSGNFGYTSNGVNLVNTLANKLVAVRVPIGCSGTITAIKSFNRYVSQGTEETEFAIYSDNGSGTDPDTLLGHYGKFYDAATNTANAWITDSTVSQSITGAPDYIWVVQCFENNISRIFYDAGTTPVRIYSGTAFTWPETWPTADDSAETRSYSCYVTF